MVRVLHRRNVGCTGRRIIGMYCASWLGIITHVQAHRQCEQQQAMSWRGQLGYKNMPEIEHGESNS